MQAKFILGMDFINTSKVILILGCFNVLHNQSFLQIYKQLLFYKLYLKALVFRF